MFRFGARPTACSPILPSIAPYRFRRVGCKTELYGTSFEGRRARHAKIAGNLDRGPRGCRESATPKVLRKDDAIGDYNPVTVFHTVNPDRVRVTRQEMILQTSFSTFPRGGPGIGLLLLRAAVGTTAFSEGIVCLPGSVSLGNSIGQLTLCILLILSGAALVLGCLTPLAGFVSGLCFAAMFLGFLPQESGGLTNGRTTVVRIVVISVSIILLGPGGFSLDAHLFGRREIIIPPASRPPES